ncbi:uncharacterized protein Hap1MRO34_001833 [Clarias gariepinus]
MAAVLAGFGFVMILWKGNFQTQTPEHCPSEHYYETIDDTAPEPPGAKKHCRHVYVLADHPVKLDLDKKVPSDVSHSTRETLWKKNPLYLVSPLQHTRVQITPNHVDLDPSQTTHTR